MNRTLRVAAIAGLWSLASGCSGGDDSNLSSLDGGAGKSGGSGGGHSWKDGGWPNPDGSPGAGGESGNAGSGGATETGGSAGAPAACLASTQPCAVKADCCGDLSCGTTTLGQVCCGETGAPCATANGEDCCGDLWCVSGSCVDPNATPGFQAPFPCGQSWTYSHHSGEVRRALDFINNSGNTDNSPVLAAEAGTATQHYEANGAGNYIVVQHAGNWKTYYFHLQAFSVADGTSVTRGQEVGRVGSTGNSTGPHLHFEELLDGVGMDIVLDGVSLAPYPSTYGQKSATSNNCP